MNFLKLLVDDLPLCVHDRLEVINVTDSDFSIFLFRLEFKLYFENDDFGVCELLWLLLETSVTKSLLKCHSTHQERVVDRSSGYFLYSDQILVQQVCVQFLNSRDHYFCEKILVAGEEL